MSQYPETCGLARSLTMPDSACQHDEPTKYQKKTPTASEPLPGEKKKPALSHSLSNFYVPICRRFFKKSLRNGWAGSEAWAQLDNKLS